MPSLLEHRHFLARTPAEKLAYCMQFCDLSCKYASFPKSDAVDGAGSCRTFVALHCSLKNLLVHKNLPCPDKVLKKQEKR